MNVFHYTATAAVPGWENSGDPDHNDNDFFREGLIYNIIVCLAVCLSGWPATSAALFILIDEFRSASVRMAWQARCCHCIIFCACVANSSQKACENSAPLSERAFFHRAPTEPAPISLKIGGTHLEVITTDLPLPPPRWSLKITRGQGGRAASPITAKHFTTGQRRPGCEEAK